MKKYYVLSLVLTITGAVVAATLLYLHFSPASSGLLSCAPSTSCWKIAAAGYAQFFGIPGAAFPLAFFLVLFFTLLMADYARDAYYSFAAAVIFPVASLFLVLDLIFNIALLRLKVFSLPQTGILLVVILLVLISFLWIRSEKKNNSFIKWYAKIFNPGDNADKKAVVYLYIVSVLAFSLLILSSMALANAKIGGNSGASGIKSFAELKNIKAENIVFPESKMVIGSKDAKVVIHVFIDYLCSYCRSFSKTETKLAEKYGSKIRFVYHHFPLEASCNESLTRTIYKNSCQASYIAQAAGDLGVFDDYMKFHFPYLAGPDHRKEFDYKAELSHMKKTGFKNITSIEKMYITKEIEAKVRSDARFASANGIKGTPTLFINGKRIVGALPVEILSQLIEWELEKNN